MVTTASRKRKGKRVRKRRTFTQAEIQAALDRASEADRIYFEEHPGVLQRVRPIVPGETGSADIGSATHALVTQLAPGIRRRQFVALAEIPLSLIGHMN